MCKNCLARLAGVWLVFGKPMKRWIVGLAPLVVLLGVGETKAEWLQVTDKAFIPGIEGVPGNAAVSGVALSPDESRIYAAHWSDTGSDPIAAYSTTDPYSKIEPTMSYGRCHGDVVISQDGRYAFAPSYYQGDVSRFDLQDNNARQSIDFGSWAANVWMSPNGKRVLVSFNDSSDAPSVHASVAVVDIEGSAFTQLGSSIGLDHPGPSLYGKPIAFSSDSRYAYIHTDKSTSEGATLFEIDLESQLKTRSVVIPGERLSGVAKVGDRLLVGSRENKTIYGVDLATFTLLPGEAIGLDYLLGGITLHPDGEHLFVSHPDDDKVSIIDLNDSSIESTFDIKCPYDIEFASDGRTAYVAVMGGPGVGGIRVLDVNAVPEPTTFVALAGLLAMGLMGHCWRQRRTK